MKIESETQEATTKANKAIMLKVNNGMKMVLRGDKSWALGFKETPAMLHELSKTIHGTRTRPAKIKETIEAFFDSCAAAGGKWISGNR